MLTSQCMATVWFLCIRLAYIYADVIYQKADNFIVSATPEEILSERAAISARHCSQLCEAECTAANYNSATSQCQLLAPSTLQLTAHSGSTAHFTLPQDLADGQVGMWPLNELYEGRNLVPGKPDIQLHDISFNDVTSDWMSRPVRFAGAPTSYGQLSDVADVTLTGSFAFITNVYREQTTDYPLMDLGIGSGTGTRFWIYQDKFFVFIDYSTCTDTQKGHSSPLVNNQWQTLALSYDHTTGLLSMWLDGTLNQHQLSPCSSGYENFATDAGKFGSRGTTGARHIPGHMTCTGFYLETMTYEGMLASTRPFC